MNFPSGVYTVLVTPFLKDDNDNYSIDYESLKTQLVRQIDNGIKNFVMFGTTSEAPTLEMIEKRKIAELIRKTLDLFGDDFFFLGGISGNNTKKVIEEMKELEKYFDGVMVSVPYYNKPPQRCLYNHFSKVAHQTKLPVMVYNVPSRTGTSINQQTLYNLVKNHSNICGLKDATGSLHYLNHLIGYNFPNNFKVFSGDDNLAEEMIMLGAHGVISVASNIIPKKILSRTKVFIENNGQDVDKLREKNIFLERNCKIPKTDILKKYRYDSDDYSMLFRALFCESNPIPVKFMLYHLGVIKHDYLREPLMPLEDDFVKKSIIRVLDGLSKN